MAFHARNRHSSRTTRESSRESVLGLAGWLFADLLLALSVVFLVAQDRPGGNDLRAEVERLQQIILERDERIEELEKNLERLQALCDENECGAASGLSPGEQLVVTVPQGASARVNVNRMVDLLKRSNPEIEVKTGKKKSKRSTSWEELKRDSTRIGFVIFYTRFNDEKMQVQAEENLGVIVEAFNQLGLVNPSLQNIPKSSSGGYRFENFPSLTSQFDKAVSGTSLKIRAFLFKDGPVSGTTTTTVED